MTSEEAKEQIENLRAHCSNMLRHTFTDGEDIWGKDLEALDLAIKALAQEDILDKIRAEIEASKWTNKDVRIERNALASGLDKALEIIDKYKTDNEIHCNCTDEEIAKSFIQDVEAVKDLLPKTESEG